MPDEEVSWQLDNFLKIQEVFQGFYQNWIKYGILYSIKMITSQI